MNWELDRSEPRSNRLIQLAVILGVQAAFLLDERRGEAPPPQRIESEIKTLISDLEGQTEKLAREVLRIGEEIKHQNNQITLLRQAEW